MLTSASAPPFTPNQKAYYAGDPTVNFVRPGLVIKVLGAETAADGTVRARVRFTDLRGLPLDREGVTTPGPISCSFILAYIPKGATQHVAYTARRVTSLINGVSAVQATSDTGGAWVRAAEGDPTLKSLSRGSTHGSLAKTTCDSSGLPVSGAASDL